MDKSKARLLPLSVAALGVVFGDIGTSPLYAISACFESTHGVDPSPENVIGILSLVFWFLTLVVALKYLVFVVRADNRGEGGTMALIALILPWVRAGTTEPQRKRRKVLIFFGLFGAALLYGDGIITPAISVLSAVEGLQIATPAFQPAVVPITIAILVGLFAMQSRGTASIGRVFGFVTLLWFIAITITGAPWIWRHPEILHAINPLNAIQFFVRNGWNGFFVLSAVVLCVTGGEALYADMGHFGRGPIRFAWSSIVFPALLINYFGQGSVLLERGAPAVHNTFYSMVGGWFLYPMVLIATLATVIASQALISGAYSLTQQAIQLGYLPRMNMIHTSRETEGQIYMPTVNMLLMIACVWLVFEFKESGKLASAYGVAVTGTMAITTLLFGTVVRTLWRWSRTKTALIVGLFLFIDLVLLVANLTKFFHGGWVPLLIAGIMFWLMTTWRKGREILSQALLKQSLPFEQFLETVSTIKPHRVPGTAVFMTMNQDVAPHALLHHLRHSKVLHEHVILLSVITDHVPEVRTSEKVRLTEFEHGFIRVVAHYGYIETPDVAEIFQICSASGITFDLSRPSFYLGRETFLTTGMSELSRARKKAFILMSKNARTATEFFKLPPDRVIEIGSQIRI